MAEFNEFWENLTSEVVPRFGASVVRAGVNFFAGSLRFHIRKFYYVSTIIFSTSKTIFYVQVLLSQELVWNREGNNSFLFSLT